MNSPANDGFIGGTYRDGSSAYVAFGDGTSCNDQFQAPCALITTPGSEGCFIPCGASEVKDRLSVNYLQTHPGLKWVDANSTSAFNIHDPLRLLGPSNFLFGRAMLGVYVLGKVETINDVSIFHATTSSGAIRLESGFQVLTCVLQNGCCECFDKFY